MISSTAEDKGIADAEMMKIRSPHRGGAEPTDHHLGGTSLQKDNYVLLLLGALPFGQLRHDRKGSGRAYGERLTEAPKG